MNKAADSTTKSPDGPAPFLLGTFALDILDTAWRMTIPVIVCAVGGLLADKQIGSAPWLTLLGVVVGFVCAGLLVKKQIEAVQKKERQK